MALVGAGLAGPTGPAAAAPTDPGHGGGTHAGPSRTATTWAEPTAGTSAEIEFTDTATAARASSHSPYLAEIRREAKRMRTVDIEAAALRAPLAAESVAIELFDDVRLTLATNVALSPGVGSSRVYSGGGEEDGSAILTIIGDDVHGALWQGTTKYGIEPLGGGRHLVYEDGRTFPNEAEPEGKEGRAASAPSPAAPGGPGTLATTVIDMMVAYDDSAVAQYGSVAATEAEVVEMVNLTNMVLANSLVDVEVALTNILDLGYTRNAADGTLDDSAYWAAIKDKDDGIVDNLHTQRDANSADLAATITEASAFCGISRFPTSEDPPELDAFSLTDVDCAVAPTMSFPHEIGHNFCANHDPENAGGNPCGPDSYGHFSKADGVRTVMSYDDRFIDCPDCVRIPYFSNPDVTYEGWTTGILGERDNARAVGVHAPDIAAYRTPGGAEPCEVDYTITNTWPGNVQIDLVVENTTTSTINGWTAEWTFTGDESVYNSWGVIVSQNGAEATATGDGFGATIPPGGTVTVGFQATVTGTPTVPSPMTCSA